MNSDKKKNSFFLSERKSKYPTKENTVEPSQKGNKEHTPMISFSGRKKRRFSPSAFIIPLFSLFLAILLLSYGAERLLDSRFSALAEKSGEKYLYETVNRAVGESADEGLLSYPSMVRTVRDTTGEVIYLEVDTAMLAKAKSLLVQRIDQALAKKKFLSVHIPSGSLGGWNLFSGIGLPVPVRIHPMGMTEGEVYTVLEDCGINQTRHLIRVDVKVALVLVLPEDTVTVETEVSLPLGERVLVGDVPEIYLDKIGGS